MTHRQIALIDERVYRLKKITAAMARDERAREIVKAYRIESMFTNIEYFFQYLPDAILAQIMTELEALDG